MDYSKKIALFVFFSCFLLSPLCAQLGLPKLKKIDKLKQGVENRVYSGRRKVEGIQLSFDSFWSLRNCHTGRFSRVEIDPNIKRHEAAIESTVLSIRENWKAGELDISLASDVIVERSQPFFLIKATTSAQEQAGSVHQQVNHLGQIWKYWWDSHWEGEGFGEELLGKRVLCDLQLSLALPLVDWSDGYQFDLPMVWNLGGRRAMASGRQMTNFKCTGAIDVVVPAGSFRCWRIEVVSGKDKLAIDISQDFPNMIIAMKSHGGDQLEMQLKSFRGPQILTSNKSK